MKICMVAYTYYSRDPRVRRAAEALADNGYDVDVIALREDRNSPESDGRVHLISLPLTKWRTGALAYIISYSLFFIYATSLVSYNYLKNRYKLIYCHNMPDFLVFSGMLPKFFGSKIILDVHDPMLELYSTIYGLARESVISKLILFQCELSYRFSDKVLTVHEGMRDLLVRRGVNYNKVEVIHNLPDSGVFGGVEVNQKSKNEFTLVYAGTVSPRHGLDMAIDAVEILSDEIPEIRFLIIGEGPDIPRLKELTKKKNIENRVIFEGAVPLERIPEYLVNSHLCVVPYLSDLYGELFFPTKILESFMVGLPVVCSRTPIVMRYLDETMLFLFNAGVKEDLANQIKLAYSDKELACKKVHAATEFLAALNWETEKTRLVSIIDEILA